MSLSHAPLASVTLEEYLTLLAETEAEKLLTEREDDDNTKNALDLLRIAAQQGSTKAMYRLGSLLEDATIIDNSPKEAVKWLKAADEAGHPEACARLGRIYAEGREDVPISLTDARDWLMNTIQKGAATPANYLYLAKIYDRLGQTKEALNAIEEAAKKGSSYAELQMWQRYHCGIGVAADPIMARKWLMEAAIKKGVGDPDTIVLLARALLSIKYESVPTEKLRALFVSDFDDLNEIGSDQDGRRSLDCSMQDKSGSKVKVSLVIQEVFKSEDLARLNLSDCLGLTSGDSDKHPLGIALNVDLLDRQSGVHETPQIALIMPRVEKPALVEEKPKAEEEDINRIIIKRSGHHTNNWLAVMGDMDRMQPTILKYLYRNWKQDIAERGSGLEWLPQRLHLSLGKPAFGDVYVGKIGVGCSAWIYIILTTPPPTLRPEIHTVFPVIVAKARKYFLTVKQILEWNNRIEAIMKVEVDSTTDRPKFDAGEIDLIHPKPVFPLFAIDFASRRNIWERKDKLEVFLSGIASCMVRNPDDSLTINLPKDSAISENRMDDDDDECKVDTRPRSVVPDIAVAHGKTIPWSQFKNVRGIIPNEGPRKANDVCYVQGECIRTIQLPGTIWAKSAYLVTVRIDEERKIDLDIWCLLKHMIDGRATIIPGKDMTLNVGSVPRPGDLVFADVWMHGTIATGLDPEPTAGARVEADPLRPPKKIPREIKEIKAMSLDSSDAKIEPSISAASARTSALRSLSLLSGGDRNTLPSEEIKCAPATPGHRAV